ncbi:TetR/AcrR family transcriptional regulator [Daejeonia sp. YH14]|uniref:TetR/AcrR family transcriptional regulator n=1 Tax=Daejeonia sp. YH14 TaxID=3439042 RepID=UPI003F49673B
MDRHQLFLEKVTRLFFMCGAKSLTMDDIARKFSMSKKTLYQYYKTKEDIINEVLNYLLDRILEKLNAEMQKGGTAVSLLVYSTDNMSDFIIEHRNVFVMQMIKYYPELLREHQLKIFERVVVFLEANIRQGREEGHYRENFDEDVYVRLFMQLFFSVDDSPLFENAADSTVLCGNIIDFYLNSILTEKGREILKELKEK